MYEATAQSGSNVSSARTLAPAMLCAEQFILAYDTLAERAGCTLSSPRYEAAVRGI
jgi:hypothetical protein